MDYESLQRILEHCPDDVWYSDDDHSITTAVITNEHEHKRAREKEEVLDPIINAGGMNLKNLQKKMKTSIPLLQQALKNLTESTFTGTNTLIVSHLTDNQLRDLLAQRVIKKVTRGDIKSYIHCFLIEKSGNVSRFIGHPKQFNCFLQENKLINKLKLSNWTVLLNILNSFEQFHAFESDLKNYFPQIPLPNDMKRQFGFANKFEGKICTFVLNVLCQGWSHSTFIAQTLSWCLLYNDDVDLNIIVRNLEQCSEIPGHMFIESENTTVGHVPWKLLIVIIYDNFLMVASNETILEKIKAIFIDNCRQNNTIIKYKKQSINTFSFCGIEVNRETSHQLSTQHKLQWRIIPEIHEKWTSIVHNLRSKPALMPRETMKIYGFLSRWIYIHRLSRRLLTQYHKELSALCREMSLEKHKSWNKSSELATILGKDLIILFTNEEHRWANHVHLPKPGREKILLVATDASGIAQGWIHWTPDGGIIKWSMHQIFMKTINESEAEAAKDGVLAIDNPLAWDLIILLIDNQPISHSIDKGFSNTQEIDLHTQETVNHLDKSMQNQRVMVVDTPTKKNPADTLTRCHKHREFRGYNASGNNPSIPFSIEEQEDFEERKKQIDSMMETLITFHTQGNTWISRDRLPS